VPARIGGCVAGTMEEYWAAREELAELVARVDEATASG
jgi:hypothetical protein